MRSGKSPSHALPSHGSRRILMPSLSVACNSRDRDPNNRSPQELVIYQDVARTSHHKPKKIAGGPDHYAARPDLDDTIRICAHRNYLIVFEPFDDGALSIYS